MRSLLIVPAGRPEALVAALAARPGAIVFDLGDPSAGPEARDAARRAVATDLARTVPLAERPRLVVRVAPLATALVEDDLDALWGAAPDAVLLPRAVGGCDVEHLGAKLAVREAEAGLAAGTIGIVAVAADTAHGVLSLGTMPDAGPRLRGLAFDGPALARELPRGRKGPAAAAWQTARGLLVLAATAAGVPAIELSLYPDRLADDRDAARRDGFSAMMARGPADVGAIEAFFGR